MNFPRMILRFFISMALFVLVSSCHNDDDSNQDPTNPGDPNNPAQPGSAVVVFFIGEPISQVHGELGEPLTPALAVITVHDASGKTIADHQKVALTRFNDGFVSTSFDFLLDAASEQKFYLSEFLVLDAGNNALYASPKKGSALANLVNAPLDVEFNAKGIDITTVKAEVVTIGHSNAEDFGYTQFGYSVVERLDASISVFVPWNEDFQLTNAHLKIEGVNDSTSTSPEVLWTYETDVEAKANTLLVRKSPAFRITITKPGFDTWNKVGGLKQGVSLKAQLSQPFDVYVAGIILDDVYSNRAVYMKNGKVIELEATGTSVATDVALQSPNIFVTGSRLESDGRWKQACVWRNGTRVDMPFWGETRRVLFSEKEDLFIAGTFYANTNPNSHSTAFYLKNGFETDLAPLTANANAKLIDIALAGDDVFVVGYETVGGVNKPLLWHNEVPIPLQADFSPTAITIRNNKVYIAGNVDSRAAYLQDNNLHTMSESSSAGEIIVTTTDDVYLLDLYGAYWKNSKKVTLPGILPSAFGFAMADGHVYVAGTANVTADAGSQNVMAQWIDSDKPMLGSRDVIPYSMTVIMK